jgi:hypothetical protein
MPAEPAFAGLKAPSLRFDHSAFDALACFSSAELNRELPGAWYDQVSRRKGHAVTLEAVAHHLAEGALDPQETRTLPAAYQPAGLSQAGARACPTCIR